MAVQEDDDPLWKRILTNETLWLIVAAIVILGLAFHLATSRPEEKPKGRTGQRPGTLAFGPPPARGEGPIFPRAGATGLRRTLPGS